MAILALLPIPCSLWKSRFNTRNLISMEGNGRRVNFHWKCLREFVDHQKGPATAWHGTCTEGLTVMWFEPCSTNTLNTADFSVEFVQWIWLTWILFVITRKRSCGRVMFLHLSVSHSVHSEVCVAGGVHGSMPGRDMHGRGGMHCRGGTHGRGCVWWVEGCVHGTGCAWGLVCRRDSHWSGWYASYWNASSFLTLQWFLNWRTLGDIICD